MKGGGCMRERTKGLPALAESESAGLCRQGTVCRMQTEWLGECVFPLP